MIKETEVDLMEETDRLFRATWKKYQRFLMSDERELSMHQMLFLKYLESRETCTPSIIAQQFGITLGAVTGFVDRLYNLGLITRTRSEQDRRVVLIQISTQGIESLNAFDKERQIKFKCLFEKLDGFQVAELNQALEQLNNVLDKLVSINE